MSMEDRVEKLMQSEFMKAPESSTMNNVIQEFINRTGNEAMKTSICACCTLETDGSKISRILIEHIPNSTLLIPSNPHPHHCLFNNLLLERRGIDEVTNTANLCDDCYIELERDRLPAFALANNMWIGEVPDCLETLTLVERLLIVKYFPTAYVVKLFPKQGGTHWDRTHLYSSFKGCVSTYLLDPKQVQSLVDGKLLPVSPVVLSATVAVTFITPSGKHEFAYPKTLYAR